MSATGSSSHHQLTKESRTVWPSGVVQPTMATLTRPPPLCPMPGVNSSLMWWRPWRILTRGNRPRLFFVSTSSPTTSTRHRTVSSAGGRLYLGDNIGKLKKTLLVLEWDDPKPLTRAWCLWEMVSTVDTRSEFHVLMSSRTTSHLPLP